MKKEVCESHEQCTGFIEKDRNALLQKKKKKKRKKDADTNAKKHYPNGHLSLLNIV